MGNITTSGHLNPMTKDQILELKQINLTDVVEVIKEYQQNYGNLNTVDYSQFDDLFSYVVQDTEAFFDQISCLDLEEKYTADVYEALSVLILFAIGDFDDKIQMIFTLFDFDLS